MARLLGPKPSRPYPNAWIEVPNTHVQYIYYFIFYIYKLIFIRWIYFIIIFK